MDRRTALKTAAIAAGAGLTLSARPGTPPDTMPVTPLFYRDWGSGPVVVFSHGWALNSDFWQYQMLYLAAKGFRCVAYDRRGHGRSEDPGRGYDYETLAGDLAALVERLDLRNITLVGHSMGCGEVVRYLSRYGRRRVVRLVLVGGTLPYLLQTADNPDGVPGGYFDAWRKALSSDFPKWRSENEGTFWTAEASEPMKEWGRHLPMQCSLQAAVETTRAMTETDFRNELRAIRVPTLLVHGTLDKSIPIGFARRAAQLIPGSRLVEYEGAPHGLPLTHIDRFNQELAAFLRR